MGKAFQKNTGMRKSLGKKTLHYKVENNLLSVLLNLKVKLCFMVIVQIKIMKYNRVFFGHHNKKDSLSFH